MVRSLADRTFQLCQRRGVGVRDPLAEELHDLLLRLFVTEDGRVQFAFRALQIIRHGLLALADTHHGALDLPERDVEQPVDPALQLRCLAMSTQFDQGTNSTVGEESSMLKLQSDMSDKQVFRS